MLLRKCIYLLRVFLSFRHTHTHTRLYRLAKINVCVYIYAYLLIIKRYSRSLLCLIFCIQSDQLTKCLLCLMIYEKKSFFIGLSFFVSVVMINLLSSNYSFSTSLNVLSWFNERQRK